MKLFHKIFLVYLLVSFILLVSVFGTIKLTAERYFDEIESRIKKEMFSTLTQSLAADYQQDGSWQRYSRRPHIFASKVGDALNNLQPFFNKMPLPPKPPLLTREPPGVPPHARPLPPHERVTLFDQSRVRIAGAIPPMETGGSFIMKPIITNEKTVGYIGYNELPHRPERFEPPFKKKLEALYIIGAVLFLLSGIVAYVLSRQILSPVEQLAHGTRDLTRFKFNTRIPVKTQDEIGQLARGFNHMAVTLERYESMRKQWMTDISHELRTPLSVLKGEIEAIQDGVRAPDPARMDSLHAEVAYLENIVDDLHRLSMADAGTLGMQMKPVMPVQILASVLDTFETHLQSAGLTPDVRLTHKKIVIEGDGIKLKQLFSNIIENNYHYTRRPGHVIVRDSLDSGTLAITIDDSGPGVPHESLVKIFDRLYRVDASRTGGREFGKGSGLGLAICRAVAQGHGGDIHAGINKSGGLRLSVRLPVYEND